MSNMQTVFKRNNDSGRRAWHGTAFIIEALLLVLFLSASIAIVVQVLGQSYHRSIEADTLSSAVLVASSEAEAFSADPESGDNRFVVEETIGANNKVTFDVVREVTQRRDETGTMYTAQIKVNKGTEQIYALNTSRYVTGGEQ